MDFRRSGYPVKSATDLYYRTSYSEWKKWLEDIIPSFDEIDSGIPLKIFTKDINGDAYILSIQVGIEDVKHIERFRSKFLEKVRSGAARHESKVASA